MIKKFGLLSLLLGTYMISGCAHTHRVQGTEQKSEIPAGVRVAIGSPEIKEGDKVDVFRSVCKSKLGGRSGSMNSCRDDKVGEARVSKVLDHDAAIVIPDQGLIMETSMHVEKQQ